MQSPFEGTLIRLRARELEDAPLHRRWYSDAEVLRYLGGRYPPSLASARERLEPTDRYGWSQGFTVEALSDGRPIGELFLGSIDPAVRCARLGIAIGERDFWDGGYGTDAMRVVCRFGFEMMNLQRIELSVFEAHPRAVHVYEKVGFRREALRRDAVFKYGRWFNLIEMGLLRGELA
jgi:RimJ/RimL family protein N-acetyltransferase